ncbi:MAG: hypothetical protein U1E27_01495 [Kiritimatiellia bacterium]|nr:hypothetical protein [Kiritimatiellia bacterium]
MDQYELHLSSQGTGSRTDHGAQGIKCHCEGCRINVFTVDAARPPVCPFCHTGMRTEHFRPGPGGAIGADENTEERLRKLYSHPPRWAVLTLAFLGLLLLTVAVFFQLSNAEHYWYAPMVNFYSLFVCLFIFTPFIFSSF